MPNAWNQESERAVMPSVIEPETFGTEDEQTPPVVLTPALREWHGDDEGPLLELRELDNGTIALLVYTSLEAIQAGCGEGQPFVAVLPEAIEGIQHALEVDVVLWDAVLDPAIQHIAVQADEEEGP